MNHNQVQELLSEYVLGALEPREREAVSGHIQTCTACFRLVQDHILVTTALARAFPAVTPPDELRDRVLEAVRRQPAPSRPQPLRAPVLFKQGLLPRWPAFAWATAAVVGICLLGAIVALLAISQGDSTDLRQGNQRLAAALDERGVLLATSQKAMADLHEENQRLAAMLNQQRTFNYLQALPGVNRFVLKNTPTAPGARGLLITNNEKTWGVALLLNMMPLEPGMAYQIWLDKDGKATSAGVITEVDKETGYGQLYIVAFPQPVDKFRSVFVTLEPAPGSVGPTGQPVLTAALP